MNKNIARKIDRYKSFYQSDSGLMVMIWHCPPELVFPPSIPINEVNWIDEKSIRQFAQREIERLHVMRIVGDQIDDDKIPTAMVFAGTGMIAAALVKDAVIMHHVDTNYLHPPVINWQEGLNRIGFSPDNPWYQAQMIILQTFINACDGGFGIMPFAHFGPTDLANQMHGNELFTDVYECEENVHELLECCTKAIIATETDIQINHLHGYDVEGFTFGSWTPCGGYLSCDFGDLVSPSVLRKFERPYFDRIVAEWGGAYLHHHELGRHQIPVWAEDSICSSRP